MYLLNVRRGLSANRTAVTPSVGQLLYDTDTKLLYIDDGTTPGGNLVGGIGASFEQARGTLALGSGVDHGTVTGLELPSIPAVPPVVSVSKVTGGLNLFATVRKDTITTDGFTFDLSAATDSGNYNLDYIITL